MHTETAICLQALAFLLLFGWSTLAVVAVLRLRRRTLTAPPRFEAITVLKPLSGLDPALETNLSSFFEQDHPAYEIVFGIQRADDPALTVARRLKLRYPHVPCRIVVHDRAGMNPKVSNLRAMLDAVRHDWIVVSDSNVCVRSHWLQELATVADQPGTGLVFNPIAGDFGPSIGAQLEALQLNTIAAAGYSVATEILGHPAVLGKSMLFRRSVFESLGGFESVASLLAEDYVIGRMFSSAGYRVRIAPTPARNVQAVSVRQFLARQLRWAMLRCRLQPVAFAVEPLLGPLPLIALGAVSGDAHLPLAAAAGAICLIRDAVLLSWMRVDAATPRRQVTNWLAHITSGLALGALREILMIAVWAAAPFVRHVCWRGHRLRLSAGTRLYLERPLANATLCHVE
jgi:ceramide glucosyltransferase